MNLRERRRLILLLLEYPGLTLINRQRIVTARNLLPPTCKKNQQPINVPFGTLLGVLAVLHDYEAGRVDDSHKGLP